MRIAGPFAIAAFLLATGAMSAVNADEPPKMLSHDVYFTLKDDSSKAKEALVKAGANKDVYLAATHAVFSGEATKKLNKAGFKEVVVTDSVPLEKKKQFKSLKVIPLAPLIAGIIKNVADEKSVSGLFL